MYAAFSGIELGDRFVVKPVRLVLDQRNRTCDRSHRFDVFRVYPGKLPFVEQLMLLDELLNQQHRNSFLAKVLVHT